jgi:hypothetical protein
MTWEARGGAPSEPATGTSVHWFSVFAVEFAELPCQNSNCWQESQTSGCSLPACLHMKGCVCVSKICNKRIPTCQNMRRGKIDDHSHHRVWKIAEEWKKKKCKNLLRERDILRGVLLGASPSSECIFPIGIEVVSTTWFPGTTPSAPYRKSIKNRGSRKKR